MGKVYINKTDGKVLDAYIVDEDQENYTVRMDINKPQEFTIKRVDVLFIVRKNPTGLNGRVYQKHVDLTWNPPYNPVKKYKIYVKSGGGEYREAGTSLGTRFRVTGLNCNMEYLAIVTAVDRDNYESLPSNEFKIVTQKGKPVPPRGVRIAKMTSDRNRVYTARMAWDRAEDPCGGIISDYHVYIKVFEAPRKEGEAVPAGPGRGGIPAGYRLAGRTSESVFQIKGLRDNTQYGAIVTSVDNTKDESGPGTEISFNTGVSRPDYPYPVTLKKDMSKDRKELDALITWGEVKDPFRRIAAYRVYRKEGKEFKLAGTTEKTSFAVKKLQPDRKETFTVRAVDVRGLESEDSYPASTGLLRYINISARAGCVVPLRDMAKLYRPGWGAELSVTVENLFFPGIGMGVETGYSWMKGKTNFARETSIVPFMLGMSYRYQPARWFAVAPLISFGGALTMADMKRMFGRFGTIETLYLFPEYSTRREVELMFSAGVNALFIIKKTALIQAGARYSGIIEKKGIRDYVSITLGAGVTF
jgi:fibronectin type 3 domain-containing protein